MRKYFATAGALLLGAALYGVGVTVFINPHKVLLGGATGLATILNVLFKVPLGLGLVLINLPLLVATYFLLRRHYAFAAIVGTLLLSVSLQFCSRIPPFQGDRLLSVLCGAALSGAGVAIICGQGFVTGGSDLLALLLQKKFPAVSFGGLVLAVDAVVIIWGGLIYRELEAVLYSLLLSAVYTAVLNAYLKGRTQGRMAFIISAVPLEKTIIEGTGHGVTILSGTGGYTGDGKNILFCAVHTGDEKALRRIVYAADPKAFMVVGEATEILGFGFQDPGKEAIK